MRQATRGKGKQNEVDNSLQLKENNKRGPAQRYTKLGACYRQLATVLPKTIRARHDEDSCTANSAKFRNETANTLPAAKDAAPTLRKDEAVRLQIPGAR